MPNNQKRKRKRTSESDGTPAKKSRRSAGQAPKTSKTPKTARTQSTRKVQRATRAPRSSRKETIDKKLRSKKETYKNRKDKLTLKLRKKFLHKKRKRTNVLKKRRRRTKDLRQKVARTLERALVEAPGIPFISHLFTDIDSCGTPRAPLRQILRQLKISNFVKNTHFLNDALMKSLSNFTTIFVIEEDEPFQGLYLKYWPSYDKEVATVYVDNLPEGCCEEQLMRLASCYGTVAELRIAKKGCRMIRPKHHRKKKPPGHPAHRHIHRIPPKKKPLIDVGSRPKPFGFIRFVDPDSAAEMIRDFVVNDPSIQHEKLKEKRKLEVQLQRPADMEEDSINCPDLLTPGDEDDLAPPFVPQEFYCQTRPFANLYMTKLIREIRFLKMRRKRRPWPMYLRLRRLMRRFAELKLREYVCLRKAGIVQQRKGIRKAQLLKIYSAFPPETANSSSASGRAPPPTSPETEEPSTSDEQTVPLPYYINIQRSRNKKNHHHKKKKSKTRKPPKRKEYIEKYVNGVLVRKKRNRRRKKMSRKLRKYIPGGQVRRFFEDIQVLSLKKYLDLKKEWLELRRLERERMIEQAEEPPAPDLEDPGVEF